MIKRFALWRLSCAATLWQEHISECYTCDFDQPCPRLDQINRRRDFWRRVAWK
jgi:hypothetical protein